MSRASRLLVAPITAYQRFVSPLLPRRCKYEPTCSAYASQAIGRYGMLRGLVLGSWRVLRCNPWSHGGYDPVEAQTLFRSTPPGRPQA
ncbi:MAG: yidD [Solirubrobacterales bacterium]|nr:yidD [Solirubrobacterales bacterium]